jgi:hypothetical protein
LAATIGCGCSLLLLLLLPWQADRRTLLILV